MRYLSLLIALVLVACDSGDGSDLIELKLSGQVSEKETGVAIQNARVQLTAAPSCLSCPFPRISGAIAHTDSAGEFTLRFRTEDCRDTWSILVDHPDYRTGWFPDTFRCTNDLQAFQWRLCRDGTGPCFAEEL